MPPPPAPPASRCGRWAGGRAPEGPQAAVITSPMSHQIRSQPTIRLRAPAEKRCRNLSSRSAPAPRATGHGPIRETTDASSRGTDVLSVDRSGLAVATVMAENEAPVSSAQPDPFPFLDRAGYASLVGGCLVVLITFLTSYSHVDLLGIRFTVNQQIGIPVLLAAVAALVGEVKLASNGRCADQSAREREARAREQEARVREREANEAARERDRTARDREQAARRSRIQARCLVAQCRFLLADTALNRLQLSEALALLIEEIKPSES